MRTDIVSFVTSSSNRKKIVKTLMEYHKRQWSCSSLEDLTKLPHATVFRTIEGLVKFGILKKIKINKKTMIFELVEESPFVKELERILNIEKVTYERIGRIFINNLKSKDIYSAVLYGSVVKGEIKPDSDIDILVIIKKHDKTKEGKIYDMASKLSVKFNKTISVLIMGINEIDMNDNFIKSVKENMILLYGKNPF